MRATIVLLLLAWLAAGSAAADVRVKQVVRLEPYYDAVPQGGTETAVDLWFGGGKLAVITPNGRAICDPAAKRLYAISTGDSTYCEIALPVNRDSVLAPDYKARIDRWYFEGHVAPTDTEKTIAGLRCASYRGERWIQLGEDTFSETENLLWLAKDTPFDWNPYRDLRIAILSLARNSDAFIAAMKGLDGFIVAGEIVLFDTGNRITSTVSTAGVEESAPPEGCYSVPAYCSKIDRMPRDMFIALLQLIY